MFDVQKFKTRLRVTREDNGLNQEEFAQRVGVAKASISYYENPKNTALPNAKVLYSMGEVLGVSFDYLMGMSDSKWRENIDIAAKLGLTDQAISRIEEARMTDRLINFSQLDIASALNVMLASEAFCDEFFPNFHRYVDKNTCAAIIKAIADQGILTENTDGSSIFLLGMEQALRALRNDLITKEGSSTLDRGIGKNGEHNETNQ